MVSLKTTDIFGVAGIIRELRKALVGVVTLPVELQRRTLELKLQRAKLRADRQETLDRQRQQSLELSIKEQELHKRRLENMTRLLLFAQDAGVTLQQATRVLSGDGDCLTTHPERAQICPSRES